MWLDAFEKLETCRTERIELLVQNAKHQCGQWCIFSLDIEVPLWFLNGRCFEAINKKDSKTHVCTLKYEHLNPHVKIHKL